MGDESEMRLLLRAVVRCTGHATQRQIAVALRITKVQARRRLRAAIDAGFIEEGLDETPQTPGKRVFSITPAGRAKLDRLG